MYLNWEEIALIYQTDLSNHLKLEKYRDLFVFGCLTELRFSDFSVIKPEDIRNDMLFRLLISYCGSFSVTWCVQPL